MAFLLVYYLWGLKNVFPQFQLSYRVVLQLYLCRFFILANLISFPTYTSFIYERSELSCRIEAGARNRVLIGVNFSMGLLHCNKYKWACI